MVQGLAESGRPELALSEVEKFIALAPGFALRAEVEVVLGRIREQQGAWPEAITGYDNWLTRFPTNALRPQVEYQRALANYKAGRETNALAQFTNFVAQFPQDPLAPRAQWWVADYFYRQPDFYNAEINYKPIFQNWPTNELAFEARMRAGRAAMGGTRYNDAITHFTNLTSILKPPHPLRAQALFAYGDALMAQKPSGTNALANYDTAILVFGTILQEYPTNPIALLARGEMAYCYKQMGAAGASNAMFHFSQVLTSAVANVAVRSEAQVGLATVILEMAQREPRESQTPLLRQALSNLLEVVHGTILRNESETRDLFWVAKAGLEAGALHERLGEWEQAELLYARLQNLVPVLRTTFQKKIDQARERRAAEKAPPHG
jgi:tetratricopeptide (TPR) repeat protein